MTWRSKTVDAGATAEEDEINIEHFNSFVRELELYPARFQEYFFDEMNEKYIQKKNQLIAQGEYQEELQAQNYKASLKQRVVIQLNSGSTVFSLPLFLSDYYTLESKRAWSKDRVTQKANELAVWEGQNLTPLEFYTKFVEDYIKESTKAQDLLREDLNNMTSPNPDDYPKTEEGKDKYDRAVFMFEARKSAKLQTQREAIANTKAFLSFFKPFTKVYYEGNLGMFIGYKIKQTGTKFKYTDGNIEFIFCFLSKYPILHLKLSSNGDELKAIRDSSQLFLGAQSFKFGQSDMAKIDDWRPNLNRRQVRRFMSGNILSGIVEANKRKKQGDFRSWALTRFTNIDGSIATAIELKFERDLPDDARIRVTTEQLAVAADNTNTYSYIEEIPESYGTTFDVSQGYVRNQNIYPIWNVEGEKICDRAICIVHRRPYMRNANGEGQYQDIVQFEVMQSYVVQTIKETKQKVMKERKEGEKLYNKLYHDQEFQQMFSEHLVTKTPERTKIDYAFARIKDTKDKNGYTTKYNEFNTYIKRYEFKLSEREAIVSFLSELYKRYDVSFNFRSDVAEYFNVEAQSDLFDPSKKEQVRAFPDGEYQYRFMRRVSDNVLEAIPNLIRKTFDGAYGGVVLSQPLMPNMLPSFEMKPFKFANEIYVKLTLAVLSDEDKSEFVKRLEEMAEVNDDDAFTIGEYVRGFLAQRSVGTTYFFGDLRVSEYGNIFREYALKQDLEKLVLEERGEDVVVEAKPVKTQVTLDDAENFIIKLYQLI